MSEVPTVLYTAMWFFMFVCVVIIVIQAEKINKKNDNND